MYCGGTPVADEAAYRAPRCAGCDGTMEDHPEYDKAIAHCIRCDSLWFGRGVLETMLDKIEAQAFESTEDSRTETIPTRDPQAIEYRKCPSCDAFMARHNHGKISGIIIDTCRQHGTYLDAGELQALQAFVLAGGAEASRQFVASEKRSMEEAVRRDAESTKRLRTLARVRLNRWSRVTGDASLSLNKTGEHQWWENPMWNLL